MALTRYTARVATYGLAVGETADIDPTIETEVAFLVGSLLSAAPAAPTAPHTAKLLRKPTSAKFYTG